MLRIHKISWRIIALLAIPTLWAAESQASVAGIDVPPSVVVRYHDLNLSSQEGVANLYGRIHAAAVVVCRSVEGPQLVSRVFWTEWNACINHAIANAVNCVHNENLSAYHWERIRGWKRRLAATGSSRAGY